MDNQILIEWLIVQPPFMQVAASLVFFILVAPAVLAGVALATSELEGLIAQTILPLLTRSPHTHVVQYRHSNRSGSRAGEVVR